MRSGRRSGAVGLFGRAATPQPRRGPDDDAEPAIANVPASDADVNPGELIAAQLPQVLVMHDAGRGSQVRGLAPASRCAATSISAGVRTFPMTTWTRVTLDDHCGGQTVVCGVGPCGIGRRAADLWVPWRPLATR